MAAMLAAGTAAHALPLTLGVGQSVGFDFDFTAQSPAAPYTNMSVYLTWSSIDVSGREMQVDVYNDRGLGGGLVETLLMVFDAGSPPYPAGTEYYAGHGITEPGAFDGIFSLRVTALTGRVSLTDAWAMGTIIRNNVDNSTPRVDGAMFEVPPQPVPLPGTLSLALLALMAARGTGRRH